MPSAKFLRLGLISTIFFVISSCNFAPQIAQNAVSYNQALEKSGNELLLINIVRAYRGFPMYFADLEKINGNLSFSSKLALDPPIGGDAEEVYGIKPDLTYTSSPNFDVLNLSKVGFVRGITKPISPETFLYYWNYGWPKDLLLNLFIEKILFPKGSRVCRSRPLSDDVVFVNDPDDESDYDLFRIFLDTAEFTIEEESATEVLAENLTIKELSKIQTIVSSSQHDLKLLPMKKPKRKKFKIQRKSRTISFKYKCKTQSNQVSTPDQDSGAKQVIYLRSPQAILFYLGEVMRAEIDQDRDIFVRDDNRSRKPLFRVRKEKPSRLDGSVAVDYRGDRYLIPHCDQEGTDCTASIGRTLTALALVNQLLGLQKDEKELPLTQTVRISGQ